MHNIAKGFDSKTNREFIRFLRYSNPEPDNLNSYAAKRLGRRFIGIDIDKKYVNITKDKLSGESSNSKISDVWVSFCLDGIITK